MLEWDPVKARRNRRKHGVGFPEAAMVLEDPRAVTIDQFVGDELRHVTIGMDASGRLLVVVYTRRGDRIRLISARKAIRYEERQYEG